MSFFKSSMDDAIEGATPQEKFLMMMNDRIGNMEETLFEMRNTMIELREYITTTIVGSCITLPKEAYPAIDESIVDKVVAAVQTDARIIVDRAWVIFCDNGHDGDYHLTIKLQLEKRVVAKDVSAEMSEHIVTALGALYVHDWTSTTLAQVERLCHYDGNTVHQKIVNTNPSRLS